MNKQISFTYFKMGLLNSHQSNTCILCNVLKTFCVTDKQVPKCAIASYVINGYRPRLTQTQAIYSVFAWHNETVNIWTHLFPSLCFLLYTCLQLQRQTSYIFIISAFLMSVALVFSATFHVMCSTPRLYYKYLTCDNVGMFSTIGLCVGSAVHLISINLTQMEHAIYIATFAGILAVSLYFVVEPTITKARSALDADEMNVCTEQALRGNKLAPFSLLLCISFWMVPVVHLYFVNKELAVNITLILLWEYIAWGICFVIWFLQLPERCFPGSFDYFGNSHNLFHCCIVLCNVYHISNVNLLLKANNIE